MEFSRLIMRRNGIVPTWASDSGEIGRSGPLWSRPKTEFLCWPFVMMVSNVIRNLTEQFSEACDSQPTIAGMLDVTNYMQVSFNSEDWTIIRARLGRPSEGKRAPILVLVIGFRSEMLRPFGQVRLRSGDYLPCDIPGLVPGLAAVVDGRHRGLVANALVRGDVTRMVLVFEGKVSQSSRKALRSLATSVYRFFTTWREWRQVLLATVERDPVVSEWPLDWREFLAGESGFVVMPWFRPMSYSERATAMDRVVLAARALLASVLSQEGLEDPLVVSLQRWLDDLTPLPQVLYESRILGEAEVQ